MVHRGAPFQEAAQTSQRCGARLSGSKTGNTSVRSGLEGDAMALLQSSRQQQVILRRWNHSLAVRLPARLLKRVAGAYRVGMPLRLELRQDGSLLLRPDQPFNRLQFSWLQTRLLDRQPCSAPTWPLLRGGCELEPEGHRPPRGFTASPDPGPTYLDTGVVLPLICHEACSDGHLRWFGSEERQLVSAELLWMEASAALRLKPRRVLERGDSHAWLEQLLEAGGVELLPLLREGLQEATALLADPELPPLQPSQAQHLATALRSGCHRLISADPLLGQAARQRGLIVHAPGQWPPRLPSGCKQSAAPGGGKLAPLAAAP